MSNWPDWLPLRDDLRGLSAYGAPQINNVAALNTNENPFPLPKSVIDSMIENLKEILPNLNRYPDRDAVKLRTSLSEYINGENDLNIEFENIWVANGSNEILQTLVLACGQEGVLGFTPSYSMHPIITKVCGATWISGVRNDDFTLDVEKATAQIRDTKPSIIFITTPNNPTGTSLKISEIKSLAAEALTSRSLLVVDEAYAEFSDNDSAVKLISEFPNIVVVRTMSKAFALAGARVGYLVANPKIVEVALIARLPYHLSSQTQAIAIAALTNHELLQKEVDLLIAERTRVVKDLQSMGFEVIPSDANFLLFSGFKENEKVIWQSLLESKVLIRDVGLPGYLRVTIGTPAENNQFLAAIALFRP